MLSKLNVHFSAYSAFSKFNCLGKVEVFTLNSLRRILWPRKMTGPSFLWTRLSFLTFRCKLLLRKLLISFFTWTAYSRLPTTPIKKSSAYLTYCICRISVSIPLRRPYFLWCFLYAVLRASNKASFEPYFFRDLLRLSVAKSREILRHAFSASILPYVALSWDWWVSYVVFCSLLQTSGCLCR